ncbi:MAG: hypothetical protein A2107_04210 [Verrucomicrobia bacterium GWF2_62_7]|nr:MAG: hypothetical protein A2107_04210 [Verrucomicrobia bacterium GWF2_62_7]
MNLFLIHHAFRLAFACLARSEGHAAYAERRYEVVSARYAEGDGAMLLDVAAGLLKGLRSPTSTPNN